MIRTTAKLLATGCLGLFAVDPAVSQSTPNATAQPMVVVLDAGVEPRRELRYRFVEGSSETASVEMDIELAVSMGAERQPVGFPTVRMLVDLGPSVIADDGSARYDFAISEAELIETAATNPALAAALGQSLVRLPGVSGWARIDSRGTMLDGDLNIAAGADIQINQIFDSAEQSLQQMSAPLPLEPVGIGAQWQVTEDVESAGFSVAQTAIYTLTSSNGDDVTLGVTLTQTGADQAVEFAGLPAGVEARLESLEAAGTGTMRISLNRFVPRSDSAVDMTVALGLAVAGQAQQLGLAMRTEMRTAPAE